MKSKRWLISLALVVVLVLSFSLTACEPSEPPEEKVRLNVGTTMMLEDLKLTGMIGTTGIGCHLTQLCYDLLWILGSEEDDYDPIPVAATGWATDDGKTWNFTLREDATFHDGTPVTAEDVAFTYEYLVPADYNWAYPDTICDEINVINNYTVQLVLQNAIAGKSPAGNWCPILPKHIWEPYKDDMMSFDNVGMPGSGPYKVKDFEPGEWILLEAYEDYWGIDEGHGPYIDEILCTAYATSEAMEMALANEEIDFILCHGISPLNLDLFEDDPRWTIYGATYTWRNFIIFNLAADNAFGNSLDVRKAVMHAIDRDYLIDMCQYGYGAKIDSLVLLELEQHNPDLPQLAYNVTLAEQLLDDAGYNVWVGDVRTHNVTAEELSFEFLLNESRPTHLDMGTLIIPMLEAVGFELEMVALDKASYDARIYNPQDLLYTISLGGKNPSPSNDNIWDICYSENAWNMAAYNNTDLDTLYLDMLAELDWPTRVDMIFELQEIVAEDLPYGYLTHDAIIDVLSTDFTNYKVGLGGASAWFNPWSLRLVKPAS